MNVSRSNQPVAGHPACDGLSCCRSSLLDVGRCVPPIKIIGRPKIRGPGTLEDGRYGRSRSTRPDFTLPDQHGEAVTLSALRGSPVILYFYPRDHTPGCTAEACAFRDARTNWEGAGA